MIAPSGRRRSARTVTVIWRISPLRLASSASLPDAEQLALAEHEQPIAGLADLGQDVARDQDRVVLLEVVDEVAHLDDLHRVETAGRLVEDEELRLVDDRLRDADALAEAVRQRADQVASRRRRDR